MTYADYIRSPQWRETRRGALHRAFHRCQICNGESFLEVHHRDYTRLGHEWAEDLTVLCAACHKRNHEAIERHGERDDGELFWKMRQIEEIIRNDKRENRK